MPLKQDFHSIALAVAAVVLPLLLLLTTENKNLSNIHTMLHFPTTLHFPRAGA